MNERGKMSKSIKITEGVYQELLSLQRPRETLEEIVQRLINLYYGLQEMRTVIEGNKEYQEWKMAQRELAREVKPTEMAVP